jgi:hypothetical protein
VLEAGAHLKKHGAVRPIKQHNGVDMYRMVVVDNEQDIRLLTPPLGKQWLFVIYE